MNLFYPGEQRWRFQRTALKTPSLLSFIFLLLLAGCLGSSTSSSRRQRSVPVLPTLPPQITRIVTVVMQPTLVKTSPAAATPDPELAALLAMPVTEITAGGEGMINLRSGPAAIFDIVARVDTGTKLHAIAVTEHGEWLVLRHPADPNRVAWVYTAFTDYDPARHKLPTIHNLPPMPAPSSSGQ